MKKKVLKSLTVSVVLALMVGTSAFAKDNVSSYKHRDASGGRYRATGWVSIINDKGKGVHHYTTAQLKQSRMFSSDLVLQTSGRKWGTGTVHATTPWDGNSDSYAAVLYGK